MMSLSREIDKQEEGMTNGQNGFNSRDLLLWENGMYALVIEAKLHRGLRLLAIRYHPSFVEHHFYAHTIAAPKNPIIT